jgi:hypothetical protein
MLRWTATSHDSWTRSVDLNGTLLRGETVCEVLAKPLGRIAEMKKIGRIDTVVCGGSTGDVA